MSDTSSDRSAHRIAAFAARERDPSPINLTLPEEMVPAARRSFPKKRSTHPRGASEEISLRLAESRLLSLVKDALSGSRGKLIVLCGPRNAGRERLFSEILPQTPSIDLMRPEDRKDAEEAPLSLLSSYAPFPTLLVRNIHLSPKFLSVMLDLAGKPDLREKLKMPKVVVADSFVRVPEVESAAERLSDVATLRIRTLTRGEMTGGGRDFLERLGTLDFPGKLSYDECNRGLVLGEAMRGGYPTCRDGTPDERHDFFHDLIRAVCHTDLPVISRLKNPQTLRKVYRMVGAASGEVLNLTQIARVLDIGRPLVRRCVEALESLYLVEAVPVWSGADRFERSIRSPKHVVTDSGWLCGLLGQCAVDPNVLPNVRPDDVRRLLSGWTWAQLAALVDDDSPWALRHFALRTGLTVEWLLEHRENGRLIALQTSSKENVGPEDFSMLAKFRSLVGEDQPVQSVLFYCGQSVRRYDGVGAAVPFAHLWR